MDTTNIKYNEAYIVQEYSKGRTAKEIAVELGTYNTTIRRILLRNNVVLRGVSETLDHMKGIIPFKEDTEGANYFLGFIAADGNVASRSWKYFKHSIRLNTCLDPQILESYRKWAGITTKVQHKFHKIYNTPEYCVEFCSKPNWDYMNFIGITGNKSHSLKYKREITIDFIRGVFDGDGCVSSLNGRGARFQISTASKCFAEQLAEFLTEYNPTLTLNGSCYCVSIYRKNKIKNLFHALYDNATYLLERKRDKFGSLIGETL